MPNKRIAKKVTLGWPGVPILPQQQKGKQTTIKYWRQLLNEAGIYPDTVELVAKDRKKISRLVNQRVSEIREWELAEAKNKPDNERKTML